MNIAIDRSTLNHKPKPDHKRPLIKLDDSHSAIYEGEVVSFNNSSDSSETVLNLNDTQEFLTIEESSVNLNSSDYAEEQTAPKTGLNHNGHKTKNFSDFIQSQAICQTKLQSKIDNSLSSGFQSIREKLKNNNRNQYQKPLQRSMYQTFNCDSKLCTNRDLLVIQKLKNSHSPACEAAKIQVSQNTLLADLKHKGSSAQGKADSDACGYSKNTCFRSA